MSLEGVLRERLRVGNLEVLPPTGRSLQLGDGSGPRVEVFLPDKAWALRIALNPGLAVGEAYMEGALTITRGDIRGLAEIVGRNTAPRAVRPPSPLVRWWRDRRLQANARAQSRRNVAHHYDLSVDFYRRFLDADLQYSCAYFPTDGLTLEEAQAAKKAHIAAKLLLSPDQRVLDIGCGWGGLALTLARAGAQVDGVTLSKEQHDLARARAAAAGLEDRARFSLTDYRDVAGPYDRIVSVGMFEHVGRPNYGSYFEQVARLLAPDGVAVIHSIGRADGPSFPQPWVAKHIFPGGYIPSLSEVLPAVERAGLIVTDIEILRRHYAETLRMWSERFQAARAEIAQLYDERFCRMWEFYLAFSEMAFRYRDHMVFQLQLARRGDAVPITRDYLAPIEADWRVQAQAAA